MKVTTELNDYSDPAQPNIRVHNHWNNHDFVVLEIDGKRYTVSAREMTKAVENATNYSIGMW